MYTRQLEWAKWAAVDEYRKQQETEAARGVSRMGAITPPSEDELALAAASRPAPAVVDEAPTTPKAGQKRLRKEQEHPVTPPPRERVAAAAAAASESEPNGPPPPLDVTQGPPPGQPRKTPKTQRVLAAMELDEADAENYAHINAPDLLAEDDETEDEKMANAEEAKDSLGALGVVNAGPPPSPVKGGGAATRGRAAQPRPVRQAPSSERTTRTTRASTRTQTAASTAKTTTGGAATGHAAALKARGATAAAKAKAAAGTGAGAPTTGTTNTSYKVIGSSFDQG